MESCGLSCMELLYLKACLKENFYLPRTIQPSALDLCCHANESLQIVGRLHKLSADIRKIFLDLHFFCVCSFIIFRQKCWYLCWTHLTKLTVVQYTRGERSWNQNWQIIPFLKAVQKESIFLLFLSMGNCRAIALLTPVFSVPMPGTFTQRSIMLFCLCDFVLCFVAEGIMIQRSMFITSLAPLTLHFRYGCPQLHNCPSMWIARPIETLRLRMWWWNLSFYWVLWWSCSSQ